MNQKINIWLDDLRPVNFSKTVIMTDVKIARNYKEFTQIIDESIKENKIINYISFDHDLGEKKTGYDCAKYLIETFIENNIKYFPDFAIHSMNPVGRTNIQMYLGRNRNYIINDK